MSTSTGTHDIQETCKRPPLTPSSHAIAIIHRLLTYLSVNKIRLTYHWSELWRTLLSLMRFLTTYATDLTSNLQINTLTSSLTDVLAFCVSGGDTFLPDPSSYDDLFYKLVETGPVITKFKDVYSLSSKSQSTSSVPQTPLPDADIHSGAIDTLLSVSTHFYTLLFHSDSSEAAPSPNPNASKDGEPVPVALPSIKKKNLSPREVHRIIKQGYETLSIQPPEGLSAWSRWRETDWKSELKKAGRVAVDDCRLLVA